MQINHGQGTGIPDFFNLVDEVMRSYPTFKFSEKQLEEYLKELLEDERLEVLVGKYLTTDFPRVTEASVTTANSQVEPELHNCFIASEHKHHDAVNSIIRYIMWHFPNRFRLTRRGQDAMIHLSARIFKDFLTGLGYYRVLRGRTANLEEPI